MRVYFDASLLVSLFVADDLASRVSEFVRQASPTPVVCDFASAISRITRMGFLDHAEAGFVFSEFDVWCASSAVACRAEPEDVIACEGFLGRLHLPLRTPYALNIAIARAWASRWPHSTMTGAKRRGPWSGIGSAGGVGIDWAPSHRVARRHDILEQVKLKLQAEHIQDAVWKLKETRSPKLYLTTITAEGG